MRPSPALSLAALVLACLSASRCAAPPEGAAAASIVEYNVQSLFDASDDGTEFEGFSVARGEWDDARYRLRLARVGEAVLAACPSSRGLPGPDLLCLEEVENASVLEALRAGPLAGSRYRYAAIAPAEGGPFSVCALSRLPVLASSCHAAAIAEGGAAGARAGRCLLELELDAGSGRRLFVLACHWKSKLGGAEATEEARRAEAALARSRAAALLEADPSAAIVICGDFNEGPDEYELAGEAYPTALMPASAAAGTGSRAGADVSARLLVSLDAPLPAAAGGEPAFFSPWGSSGGYSYSLGGRRERIDGFLLSPGLIDGSGLDFASFAPAMAAFLMDAEGNPAGWSGRSAKGYSDHLPLLLVLGDAAGGLPSIASGGPSGASRESNRESPIEIP